MPTVKDLTPAEWEIYRATARRRRQDEQAALAGRETRAWELARQAAALLRQEFQATRVVVFGSLAQPDGFTPWSDVDLAAWGIRPQDTLRAMGAAFDLDPEIEVNLVDVNTCSVALREAIERDGVDV